MGNDKVSSVLEKIRKKHGATSASTLGEDSITNVECFSSGCLGIDIAIGKGFPKGRIIEIYGTESAGKSSIAIEAIVSAQKNNMMCAFIDAEHAFDKEYAKDLGVDMDSLIFCQPDSAEEALGIMHDLASTGDVGLIILDSVAALAPQAEIEGDMGDSHMGLMARLMGQALRRITGIAKKNNCTIIAINQIRNKIGIQFGSNEVTTGGNSLKFYASIRIDVRRKTQIKRGDVVVGNQVKFRVVKNKVAPPFREVEFNIMYGIGTDEKGIDKMSDLIYNAINAGVINQAGSWYSYGDEKIGQGSDKVRQYIIDNSLFDEIYKKTAEVYGIC